MDFLRNLGDPKHVKHFQEFCGLQTPTRKRCDNGHAHGIREISDYNVIYSNQCPGRLTRNGIKNGYSSQSTADTNGFIKNDEMKDINSNGIDSKSNNKNGYHNNSVNNNLHMNSNGHSCNGELLKNGITVLNGVKNGHATIHSNGTKDFLPEYKVKYALPYYIAMLGSFLGDELFYLTFYPFLLWNMDSVLARKTIFVWTLVMFIGQATKDYLKVPRPPSPPVVHLETHHLREFSLPSTHAMAGTVMPIMMAYLLLERYEFPFWLAVGCIPVWTITVCLSRLYLGVHSILDVSVGVIYTVLITAVTLPVVDGFDNFLQMHPLSPVIIWMIGLAGCTVCYPAEGKDIAKGAGVRIVAIYMGLSTAIWLNYQLGVSTLPTASTPYHVMTPSLKWLILSLLRFVLGTVVLAVSKTILQKFSVQYFSYLANLKKPNKLHPSVETGYIIVTYSILGILLQFGIPFMFKLLGISRKAILEIH
ncbi:hypothetical protein SNE40_023364 [Patella caerulea]|uniref:Phosphatidic acid phosphatase type 2/haloperoxidase domain-containing protein n=1 Tax=Patella caerulea TaxID=87958 RepID=A0AAN8G6A1_PATCE